MSIRSVITRTNPLTLSSAASVGSYSRTAATLVAAAAAAAGARQTWVIDGSWTIDANPNLPSNIVLDFQPGAVFAIQDGVTCQLANVPIAPPNQQIFTYTGSAALSITGGKGDFWVAWTGAPGSSQAADQNGINRALAAMAGGVVRALPISYVLAGAIRPPSNTVLRGSGWQTVFQAGPGVIFGAGGIVEVIGRSNVVLEDFTIDGNKAATPNGESFGIEVAEGSTDIFIRRIRAINCPGADATGITGGDGIIITETAGGVAAQPQNIFVDDCVFDANVRTGGAGTSGKNVVFRNCRFSGTTGSATGFGFDLEPDNNTAAAACEDWVFDSCSFNNNNNGGLSLNNAQQATFRGMRVVNCRMVSNTGIGLEIVEVHESEFVGNKIRNNGNDGIQIGGSSDFLAFLGNVIRENTGRGIDVLTGSRFLTIQANDIIRNGLDGIAWDYTSGGNLMFIVSGNRILNNSTAAAGVSHGIAVTGNAGHPVHNCRVDNNLIGNNSAIAAATQQDGINLGANVGSVAMILNIIEGELGTTLSGGSSTNGNIAWDFTAGLQLGIVSTGLVGFHGAAPSAQLPAVADAAGGATVDAEARTAINSLLSRVRTKGFIVP